eukprot:1193659-Prorocentrum_minimum.AAC.1
MRVYSTQSKIAWDNAVKLSSSQIDIVVNRKACHQVVVNASIGRTFSGLTAKTLPLTVSVRASCPGMRRVHLKNQYPGMPHALVSKVSESAKAVIEQQGGSVETAYYNGLGLRALMRNICTIAYATRYHTGHPVPGIVGKGTHNV